MVTRRKLATALLGAVATLLLAAAPHGLEAGGWSLEAAAAQGGSGQGNNGSNGSSADSNSGGGQSGSSSSGNDKDKDKSNKGQDAKTDPGGSSDAGQIGTTVVLPVPSFGVDFGKRSNEYIDPVTGTMIEINGSNVEVLHVDGIREEIMDGRYRMNDAQGRMIIERKATESDRARVRAMIR